MIKTRSSPGRGTVILGLALILLTGFFLGTVATDWLSSSNPQASRAVPVYVTAENASPVGDFAHSYADIVEPALPSVVNIFTTRVVETRQQRPLNPFEPFFRDFFGEDFFERFDQPRQRRQRSLGSGVIVSPEGYILTNNHVVDGADDIRVVLTDRRELTAEIVGTDPMTDLAVLKVDESNLPSIVFGRHDQVRIGDVTFAIGNPFGLGQTVTMGIVSAVGRTRLGITERGYEDFIQTDAAINRGNSGGALINTRGELIGINTAILSHTGGFQGVGFAIPVDMVRHVMDQILEHGEVIRGWLGVFIDDVDRDIAEAMGVEEARGALVAEVISGSPAEKAGLEVGDVIVAVDGEVKEDRDRLRLHISSLAPGTQVTLTVLRDGQKVDVPVTLAELPKEDQLARGPSEQSLGVLEGIRVRDLTDPIRRQLRLPPDVSGVVVSEIQPGSPASRSDLRQGDVIQQINRRPVGSVEEFRRLAGDVGDRAAALLVYREGRHRLITIRAR